MNITRQRLNQAVDAKIITNEQADALAAFLKQISKESPSYHLTSILYYFGGMIAIGAMTLFMNLGWQAFGGFGLLTLALLYALLGLSLAAFFRQRHFTTPAAMCATFVICLTPLAIYGFQVGMGWWPSSESLSAYRYYHTLVQWLWIFMEFGTLVVGLIMIWYYRYPFMVMPIAVTLWYMSMDLTMLLTGGNYDFEFATTVSMYFGLFMLFIAIFVDVRSRHTLDFAFWLYLFGALTFWCALSAQCYDSPLGRFFYCCVNVVMVLVGAILVRRVFVVFGALGVLFYLAYLSWTLFKNSLIFPVAVTAVGFLLIFFGIFWQKHEAQLTRRLHGYLPKPIRELLIAREEL